MFAETWSKYSLDFVDNVSNSTQVYEARLAALLAARNDRQDEHKRALERYKKVRFVVVG